MAEEKTIQELIDEQWNIIHDREALLSTKDYIGIKIAMGVSTKEDYAEEITQTEVWRQEVRDARAEIKRLDPEYYKKYFESAEEEEEA